MNKNKFTESPDRLLWQFAVTKSRLIWKFVLIVAEVVGFHRFLNAERGVQIASISSPLEVTSEVQVHTCWGSSLFIVLPVTQTSNLFDDLTRKDFHLIYVGLTDEPSRLTYCLKRLIRLVARCCFYFCLMSVI